MSIAPKGGVARGGVGVVFAGFLSGAFVSFFALASSVGFCAFGFVVVSTFDTGRSFSGSNDNPTVVPTVAAVAVAAVFTADIGLGSGFRLG